MVYILIFEIILVGILVSIFGIFIKFLTNCNNEKINYKKEIIQLFLSGVSVHIFCEIVGLNKKYCTNGYACL